MNTESLILLFLVTILQNASFTLVSRARNSGSLFYNGLASILSNGIWFLVINQIINSIQKGDSIVTGIVYTAGATIGSVLMQWFAMKFLETKFKKS